MKKRNYLKENYTVIPFWGFLFLLFWIQAMSKTSSVLEATLFPIVTLSLIYPLTTYLSQSLLRKAMARRAIKSFVIQFLLFSILVGGIFFLSLYTFSYLERIGIFPNSEYFNLDVPYAYFIVFLSSGIAINTMICGVSFFQENLKLQKTVLEHQLKILEQQITPHFMFNVLNHINILMLEDVQLASSVLVKFSNILRYQLNNRHDGNISVEQEVQFLKNFVDVEKVRWGDELQVNCTWSVENGKLELPALLLIVFIENAFKHVSRGMSDSAYVNIDFVQENQEITLKVENSKSDNLIKEKDSVSGLGLDNIRKRLELIYLDNYSLDISDSETTFQVNLKIKL